MPRYQITGIDPGGKLVSKTIQASNKDEAGSKALDQEILVQNISPVDKSKYKIKTAERLNFIRLLSVTSQSGLPILSGLQTIQKEAKANDLSRMTLEMIADLEDGQSISEAMANREGVFDNLATSLVKAGEMSGRLPETLAQLYKYENASYTFKKNLKGALAYPVVVFTFSISVMVVFLSSIVPRFKRAYDSFGEDLPALTASLMTISDFVSEHLHFLGISFSIFIALIVFAFNSARYKSTLEKIWLKIPVFGQIFFWGILIRFSKTLGTLLDNNVTFLDALYLTIDASGSAWFSERTKELPNEIKSGVNLTDALERIQIFPELALQMTRMGEESGKLSKLLLSMSEFYEKNLEYRVSTIESVIQPVIVIGLGLFIGFLVLALFLPMFNLPGVLK